MTYWILLTALFLDARAGTYSQRFEALFPKHPATVASVPNPAAPDFKTFPKARKYKTRLIEEARKGPNFAGDLTLARIGCGASCTLVYVLETRTGKIFPFTLTAEAGIDARLDSKLVVVNPPLEDDTAEDTRQRAWGPPVAYLWTGARFEKQALGDALENKLEAAYEACHHWAGEVGEDASAERIAEINQGVKESCQNAQAPLRAALAKSEKSPLASAYIIRTTDCCGGVWKDAAEWKNKARQLCDSAQSIFAGFSSTVDPDGQSAYLSVCPVQAAKIYKR